MNERVKNYLDLTRALRKLRVRTGDADCAEEDALLDSMDVAWVALTHEDVQQLEVEIEKLWPRAPGLGFCPGE